MPKHYKDMIDEIINKMDEDAPANAVAHGGVDMNPTGKKPKDKNKYKDDNEKATDVLRRVIMKKMGNNVKENFDNNNVVLRGINETLNKLEDKIDEKNGIEKEEVKLEKKQTFHDKFVKDLQDNTEDKTPKIDFSKIDYGGAAGGEFDTSPGGGKDASGGGFGAADFGPETGEFG